MSEAHCDRTGFPALASDGMSVRRACTAELELVTGKSKHRQKLTEADVLEIVSRCDNGETQAAVAREFQVSRAQTSRTVNGLDWNHVTGIQPHKPGQAKGEASGNAKLTREQVLEIVRRCRAGEQYNSVARDFPVAAVQVSSIMRGECWTHVTGIDEETKELRSVYDTLAKLTEADVLEIVRRCQAGELHREVARDFPVGRTQVDHIMRGESWSHVTGIEGPPKRPVRVTNAKLSEDNVLEIVRRHRAGETAASIARDFPVSSTHVSGILRGRSWAHATGIESPTKRPPRRAPKNTKLSEEDVLEIVRRCEEGETYREVAGDFPVGKSQVGHIMRGERWAHITGIDGQTRRRRHVCIRNPKLTKSDVVEIVRRYKAGETQASIARDFAVSERQVSNIMTGENWAHVTGIGRE